MKRTRCFFTFVLILSAGISRAVAESWTISVIDSINNPGVFSSLTFNGTGNLALTYVAQTSKRIRYAVRSGGTWSITDLFQSTSVPGWSSLVFDGLNRPNVTFGDPVSGEVKYDGWVPLPPVAAISVIDSINNPGVNSSLTVDGTGNLALTYVAQTSKRIRYAVRSGGTWAITDLFQSTSVPGWSSLVFDGLNRPNVTFGDPASGEVKYDGWVPLPPVAAISVIDSINNPGVNSSLTVDGTGNLALTYVAQTSKRIRYAIRSRGSWAISDVFQSSSTPGWSSLTFDGSNRPNVAFGDPDSGTVKYTLPFTLSVTQNSSWNLISNPVTNPIPGDSVLQLYPTSSNSHAFEFSSTGYVPKYRLANGKGYWEKFPGAISQLITGTPRTSDSMRVTPGWNIVGTISCTVDTGTIVSVPAGLRGSSWFGYEAGYVSVTELVPGKGYWVRATGAGTFVLTCPPSGGPGKMQAAGNPLDVLNAVTITDAHGGSQTLYFGPDIQKQISVPDYIMPPLPPMGAFDARFESADGGSMVETHTSGSAELNVAIQSEGYPLTVSWDVKTGSYQLTDDLGNRVLTPTAMSGTGSIRVGNKSLNKVVIKLIGEGTLPKEFSLAQNYPNPFNPSTTIEYTLPLDTQVHLKVYNILGQEVAALVDEHQKAGYKSVVWNATNLSSGVYIYFIQAAKFVQTRKMLLVK